MYRMRRDYLLGAVLIWIALDIRPSEAQYTADFQTNIISGVTSNWSGSYWIGDDIFSMNVLVIQSNGVLTDFDGLVGHSRGSNNSAVVSGSGSVWINNGEVLSGSKGGGNSLTVSNGGKVISGSGELGIASSNNSVLVSDVGSVWTNGGTLSVSAGGYGNSLVISNGGKVITKDAIVSALSSSQNNRLLVRGTGSIWKISGSLTVGVSGLSNSLVIDQGGFVVDNQGAVGGENSVLVTDTGSVWSNAADMFVGTSGAGSSLVISNGGLVACGWCCSYNHVGSNSQVVVTGTNSIWKYNNNLFLDGTNGSLVIKDGGAAVGGDCWLGFGSVSNSMLVTGSGSVLSNYGGLFVNGSLVVSNGGLVVDGFSTVGSSNTVLVTGTGSIWITGDPGMNSAVSASLVIKDGGQVIDGACSIALDSGSKNSIRVESAGIWQNDALHLGEHGSSNSLVVAGGTVLATNLTVGAKASACDNWVQLDSGSVVVTNATHNAALEVRKGQFILNGGVLQADVLVMTNACGSFVHNGGTMIIGSLVLDPTLSAVGDGIPNGWKQQHGLDPLDLNLGSEDADGDGFSNLQEYLAGTDPTQAGSTPFQITSIVQQGNDMLIAWRTAGGKTNVVQVATGATYGNCSSNFTDFSPPIIVAGTGLVSTNWTDINAATNSYRYYRVRLVP